MSKCTAVISGLNQWTWEILLVKKILKGLDADLSYWEVPRGSKAMEFLSEYKDKIVEISERKSKRIFNQSNASDLNLEAIRALTKYELTLWPSYLRNSSIQSVRADMAMKAEYHSWISYRFNLLLKLKPSFYLFGNVPTGFFNLIDYFICKEIGVKTIIFRRVELPGRYVRVIGDIDAVRNVADEECNDEKTDISEDVNKYLESIRQDYNSALPSVYGEEGGFKSYFSVGKDGRLHLKNSILKQIFFTKDSARKKLRRLINFLWIKSLRRAYEAYCTEWSIPSKFYLVCLHYQPEASTIPMGGEFAYQELMIGLLSQVIEKDACIVVKEHPSHLMGNRLDVSMKFRDRYLYDLISRWSNVKFCPISENSFSLIDKCKALVTVTGTAGFEALCRNKPVLAFGSPWYFDAPNCYLVRDKKTLKQALSRIDQSDSKVFSAEEYTRSVLKSSCSEMFLTTDEQIFADQNSVNEFSDIKAEKLIPLIRRLIITQSS